MNLEELEALANIGSPVPKKIPMKFVLPSGIPELDSEWEKAYGSPVDHNDKNCRIYLRDNPHVWVFMVEAVKFMMDTDQRFSFKTVVEHMRWNHHKQQTKDRQFPFKISNSYTSHIARYCRFFFPQLERLVSYHERNAPESQG